jgi:type IV pilus assembly protein PilM
MTKTVVGLDIGSSHIRGIERVVDKSGAFVVKSVATIKLDDVVVRHGEIIDEELLIEALKKLWKLGNFGTQEVLIGLNGDSTITRVMVLPWEKEFSKVLPFVIEDQNIGIKRSEYYMDHYTLNEFNVEEKHGLLSNLVRKKKILFTAIKKETVDQYVRVLKDAGLKVMSIDLAALALLRSHDWSQDEITQKGGVNVNVDIGATLTTVVISRLNQPIYVRVMPNVGGESITQAIQQELSIPREQAEYLKLKTGNLSPQPYRRQRRAISIFDEGNPEAEAEAVEQQEEPTPEEMVAAGIIATEASAIVINIQETINDYFNRTKETELGELNKVVISGGLANLKVIMRRLSIELEANDVIIGEPFTNLKANNGTINAVTEDIMKNQSEFSIALGLVKSVGVE